MNRYQTFINNPNHKQQLSQEEELVRISQEQFLNNSQIYNQSMNVFSDQKMNLSQYNKKTTKTARTQQSLNSIIGIVSHRKSVNIKPFTQNQSPSREIFQQKKKSFHNLTHQSFNPKQKVKSMNIIPLEQSSSDENINSNQKNTSIYDKHNLNNSTPKKKNQGKERKNLFKINSSTQIMAASCNTLNSIRRNNQIQSPLPGNIQREYSMGNSVDNNNKNKTSKKYDPHEEKQKKKNNEVNILRYLSKIKEASQKNVQLNNNEIFLTVMKLLKILKSTDNIYGEEMKNLFEVIEKTLYCQESQISDMYYALLLDQYKTEEEQENMLISNFQHLPDKQKQQQQEQKESKKYFQQTPPYKKCAEVFMHSYNIQKEEICKLKQSFKNKEAEMIQQNNQLRGIISQYQNKLEKLQKEQDEITNELKKQQTENLNLKTENEKYIGESIENSIKLKSIEVKLNNQENNYKLISKQQLKKIQEQDGEIENFQLLNDNLTQQLIQKNMAQQQLKHQISQLTDTYQQDYTPKPNLVQSFSGLFNNIEKMDEFTDDNLHTQEKLKLLSGKITEKMEELETKIQVTQERKQTKRRQTLTLGNNQRKKSIFSNSVKKFASNMMKLAQKSGGAPPDSPDVKKLKSAISFNLTNTIHQVNEKTEHENSD